MRKIGLFFFLFLLLLNLFGCSLDKGNGRNLENNLEQAIKVSKDVKMITVTGNGLGYFSEETEEQIRSRKIVLEQKVEIEVILKAIEDSSPHSGPMTDEGENFNLIITYNDNTSETLLLWLYPDRNSGRIQKENYEGPIQLFSKEDVQNIAKILAEKMS